MRGLRGRDFLAPGEALLILRCRSVHTFGMRFPIAVVFLDGAGRVVEVIRMRPRRLARPRLRARHVLECSEGAEIRRGDLLHEIKCRLQRSVEAGRR
jgi:hypothetical protein